MEFRQTQRSELDAVMDILADGRDAIKKLGIDQWQGGYPHQDIVEQDIDAGQSYVLVDDGEPLGTVALVFTGDHTYDRIEDGHWLTECTSADPDYCAIHRVAVSMRSAGRGAGRTMLREAERIAREAGAKSLRIDTHPGNVRMRGLLGSLGYIECGIIYIDHAEEHTPERIAYEKLV